MKIECLKPIVDKSSKVLILAIMPGTAALNSGQYYNSPKNIFWDILYRVFETIPNEFNPNEISYDDKIAFLKSKKIAVWDTLASCERKGNLDKNINNPITNDFNTFFIEYPNIQHIFFNGQEAMKYFNNYIHSTVVTLNRPFTILPSTSPSNQTNCFRKLDEWKKIKNYA